MTDSQSITAIEGCGIPIRGSDIDTDQIIPARFVKVISFEGIDEFVFFDARYEDDDTPKDHPMNDERFTDASILVVNSNFGCGSSREHAPQALMRWGIDAVVGESFADIFASNCLLLDIPTVTADAQTITTVQNWIEATPDGQLRVDIDANRLTYGDHTTEITVPETQKRAFLEGNWDTTALLQAAGDAIRETEQTIPYLDPRP